jgi:ribonuclease HII
MQSMLEFEIQAGKEGYQAIAGVDEAGRGPLAGPVTAAAVILPDDVDLEGVNDSKKLTLAQREKFFVLIQEKAIAYGIGTVGVDEIDSINILQATRLAMKLAVHSLSRSPDLLLIDGNQGIEFESVQWKLVKGDTRSLSIASASILAKVTRDRIMEDYHRQYPQYGFDRHKGYGTELHRQQIERWGPCSIHRKTFKGVKEFL